MWTSLHLWSLTCILVSWTIWIMSSLCIITFSVSGLKLAKLPNVLSLLFKFQVCPPPKKRFSDNITVVFALLMSSHLDSYIPNIDRQLAAMHNWDQSFPWSPPAWSPRPWVNAGTLKSLSVVIDHFLLLPMTYVLFRYYLFYFALFAA